MYNVLIVDDETIIRERVSQLVQDISLDCNVFQASNGIEAVEIICSVQIDIILADIKMPLCDGIEMLEKLSALGYSGQIVIISGFDDYTFVRKAMKLGAIDYIMKPIVASEFRAVFNDCISKIQNSRYINNFYSADKVKKIMELLFAQQRMVSQLINNTVEPEEFIRNNSLTRYPYVNIAVMDVFSPGHISETEKQAIFLSSQSAFEKCFENEAVLIQGEFNRLWVCIIFIANSYKTHSVYLFREHLLKEEIKFGMENKVFPIDQINTAYNAAISSLENFFYDIPVEDNYWDDIYPYESTIASIVESICSCDFNGFSEKTFYLFSMICCHKPKVESTRQLLANIAYDVMKQNSGYISIIGKYKFTENDIIHAIEESLSASQIRKKMISIFSLYMADFKAKQESRDEYAIQKAKKYIEEGYKDKLTLEEIAQKLGFHPNYLSTLFKQKTGTTFSDYLRNIRINKAIELMRNTNMKLYEIAFIVGYNDTAQFYRAFKKETGMSPGHYQKNIDIT